MASVKAGWSIVTGAGRGIGREHALEFARQGAKVVVNDLGAEVDGTGGSSGPAGEVVDAIRAMGGEAVANGDDVSDWDAAGRMIRTAIDAFGGLDVLVNNAGILRDRMLVNMTAAEWDDVIRVHLRGTYATSHHAAAYWRDRSKAGEANDARIINTSSPSGVYGNAGQTNYGAAKAGIAAFTIIASMELGRYGVTVNAISPSALTRMTENLRLGQRAAERPAERVRRHRRRKRRPAGGVAGQPRVREVTGRVFAVVGGRISVLDGWAEGPVADKGARWDPAELGEIIPDLVSRAAPNTDMLGRAVAEPCARPRRRPGDRGEACYSHSIGAGRLRGDVVGHPVDAGDLVDDPARQPLEHVGRQAGPNRRSWRPRR